MATATAYGKPFPRTEKQQRHFEDYMRKVPNMYKVFTLRAFRGESRPQAIAAKCLDCSGFNRADVAQCENHLCPLWPYRPYKPVEKLPVYGAK